MAESNIAYHRKYRPRHMGEHMGKIKNVVLNRFKDPDKYPHTILLSGTHGCGKTSMARLIALEVQCESKVDGHACGECSICLEILDSLITSEAGQRCEGVIELDAATTNGKNEINEIIEEALLEPTYTKYKVLILDECHMITQQAQNSLLKIVEEPPPHLVFIFCTTNAEKVLNTIKSRCQLKLVVTRPTIKELVDRMLYIAKKEDLVVSEEALRIIAKKAERVPRTALNMLEDIANTYASQVTVANVQDRTGEIATEVYMKFFKASNSSIEDIMLFIKEIKENDLVIKDFMIGLIRFVLDALNIKYGVNLEDYTPAYFSSISDLFDMYNSSEIDLLLQIIENMNKHISSDDTVNELEIVTAAVRVSKLKILVAINEDEKLAKKQNSMSLLMYQKLLKQEAAARPGPKEKGQDLASLGSVMGRNMIHVTASSVREIPLEVIEPDIEPDTTEKENLDSGFVELSALLKS